MKGLPISLNILLFLIFTLLGLLYGKKMFNNKVSLESRESIRKAKIIIICSFLLILVNVTNLPLVFLSRITWNMPLILDYHWVRLIWGINLSIIK